MTITVQNHTTTSPTSSSLGNNNAETKLVVIYAPPGMAGHLFPTVEFGKLLVAQGLEVTVVLSAVGDADGLTNIRAANPSLSFHCLPSPVLPPANADSFEAKVFGLARASLPDLRDFLRSASPAALVIDFFCASALEVGAELGIPTYFFLTTCISVVAFGLCQPVMDEHTTLSFRDLGGDLVHAPGLPPIPADHLPAFTLDRNSLPLLGAACRRRHRLRPLHPRTANTALVLHRAAGKARRGWGWDRAPRPRVPFMARCPAQGQCGISLFWQLRTVQRGAGQADGGWAGDERATVLVGCPAPCNRRRAQPVGRRRARPGHALSHGFPAPDQGEGTGRHVVGTAAGGTGPWRGRRVRDTLRMELGAGGGHGGRADAGVASVRGATHEQGVPGGRDAAGRGHGRVRQTDGGSSGGGRQGQVAD
ncbi:hypothetical protein CFC21_020118 [Triticum aestivum]|uniref:Glycosyltransferase n=2 Tax=Triticum aestivum TaxID=4565 RepID=A0A3B6B9S0_WHEAT|nr:hypothetical protein CFC21_020118 [Triticum aestivum]